MSITLTPTLIKRGVLVALLAGLMFAAGFATRDADAQPSESLFIACVNKYTGVMRMSDVQPEFTDSQLVAPGPSEEVNFCQPHEEAWALPIAFQIPDGSGRGCTFGEERAAC